MEIGAPTVHGVSSYLNNGSPTESDTSPFPFIMKFKGFPMKLISDLNQMKLDRIGAGRSNSGLPQKSVKLIPVQ